MNNNLFGRWARLVFGAVFLVQQASSLTAEEDDGESFVAPAFSTDQRGSVIQEATKAVVGRVFGVKGEAGNIKYHAIELNSRSPRNAAIRSAMIPGWGQYFNRQPVKGTVLFLSMAAATTGAMQLFSKSRDSYDEYQSRGVKDSTLYDDYDDERTQAMFLGGLAAFIWVYSIFDARRNAYNPLYSQNLKIDLAFSPGESAVRFRRRF